ncbi:hypothetical protein BYT27DRAFT_6469756 [Phlegmacium glaucopus]|nr:hypothetical protein BYT27DRAFT_6469756 [Phlegmacium glaucopus]
MDLVPKIVKAARRMDLVPKIVKAARRMDPVPKTVKAARRMVRSKPNIITLVSLPS